MPPRRRLARPTRAGAHHLPYDQFWAVDDEGTRYTARFEAGYGETAAWRGVIQLSPVPPRRARWLDLIGDGTCLLRLALRPDRPPALPSAEATAIPSADRLLTLEAERILATDWHTAAAGEPWTFGDGTQVFRLRLTPPLTAIPDAAELVLTGPSTRVRVRCL